MKIKIVKSAGGIVYKKINNHVYWLVIKHKGKDDWRFPKGQIGDKIIGESEKEAALREVREETGVTAKIITTPISHHYQFLKNGLLYKKTVYFFLMKYIKGKIQPQKKEIAIAKFTKTTSVLKNLTYKEEKDVFKEVLTIFSAVERNFS